MALSFDNPQDSDKLLNKDNKFSPAYPKTKQAISRG